MIKSFLINCKDSYYSYLYNYRGEKYAEDNYQLLFLSAFFPIYTCILVTVAVIMYRLNIQIPSFFRYNILGYFLGMIISHLPFYFIAKYLINVFKNNPPIVIENKKHLKRYLFFFGLFFLGSAVLAIVIPAIFA